ncbi:MAG: hypothetical protein E6L03_04715 [Thaumarchaeota archaeon]|nr:MAG: hypothetical protein E6L03_04715 [Nitrososphaerota archaeon]
MDLREWCNLDEILYTAETNEQYLQFAGYDYDKRNIENLSKMKSLISEIFIRSFSEPKILFLSSIENLSESITKPLELKLHDLRGTKIKSDTLKFNGKPVNWNTWRQFNSNENDDNKRKIVFDEFIKKTKYISPVINLRFKKIKEIYFDFSERIKGNSKASFNPLDGYLISEKIALSELKDLVSGMGERAKTLFRKELNFGNELIGKDPEYYDDFYFFRNRIFRGIEKYFLKIDPVITVNKTLKSIGFDFSKIYFDIKDRPGKYPSPICFFVKIPDDIRVLYKNESPYFNLQSCYHETGHAIHASSIDPKLEYWEKYKFSMGIAEIFSILIERLTKNPLYLKDIGITNSRVLSELVIKNRFMELFFVVFYTANSLMKMDFWNKKLSMYEASRLYEKLIKRYMGLEVPGEYWMLHHILPESIMYVPSYMLAAIRAVELERYLNDRFGEKWWKEANAGKKIREIMSKGEKVNLKEFSKLDQNIYMKEISSP